MIVAQKQKDMSQNSEHRGRRTPEPVDTSVRPMRRAMACSKVRTRATQRFCVIVRQGAAGAACRMRVF